MVQHPITSFRQQTTHVRKKEDQVDERNDSCDHTGLYGHWDGTSELADDPHEFNWIGADSE
jgi:hypothetical protein